MKRLGSPIIVDDEFRITLSPEVCARLRVGPDDKVDMDVRDGGLVIGSVAMPLPAAETRSLE